MYLSVTTILTMLQFVDEDNIAEGFALLASTGVVPRAVKHIFDGIATRQARAQQLNQAPPQFQLSAEFLEVCSD